MESSKRLTARGRSPQASEMQAKTPAPHQSVNRLQAFVAQAFGLLGFLPRAANARNNAATGRCLRSGVGNME